MGKLRIVADYFAFLRQNRKWWLMPIVVFLLLFGARMVFTQGSAIAPFIYAMF